jgi:hypothetical protein
LSARNMVSFSIPEIISSLAGLGKILVGLCIAVPYIFRYRITVLTVVI